MTEEEFWECVKKEEAKGLTTFDAIQVAMDQYIKKKLRIQQGDMIITEVFKYPEC